MGVMKSRSYQTPIPITLIIPITPITPILPIIPIPLNPPAPQNKSGIAPGSVASSAATSASTFARGLIQSPVDISR